MRKFIAILILFIVVGAVAVPLSLFILNENNVEEDEEMNPPNEADFILSNYMIVTSITDFRVGSEIKFSINTSKVPILYWDLGDGNVSFGHETSHTYIDSNFFTINVTFEDKVIEKTIEVKNNDFFGDLDGDFHDIRIRRTSALGGFTEIFPGSSLPVITTQINITQGTGNIKPYAGFWNESDPFNDNIVEEEIILLMDSFSIEWTIYPSDYMDIYTPPMYFETGIWIGEGNVDSFTIHYEIIY